MCDVSCTKSQDFTRIPGAFRLHNGHAISLYPKLPSLLRVMPQSRSGLWATMTCKSKKSAPTEDHFLTQGQTLEIPAGMHVVIEPWRTGHSCACSVSDAYFDWQTKH